MRTKNKHTLRFWQWLPLLWFLLPGGMATLRGQADSCGTSSNVLTINVLLEPNVSVLGGNIVICREGSVSLSSSYMGGNGTGDYQWEVSLDSLVWQIIPGATASTYITPLILDTIWYRVQVNSGVAGCGIVWSEATPIKVVPDPQVSIMGGGTLCTGNSRKLTATQSGGTGNCNLFWQQSTDGGATWTHISGANADTLSVTNISQTTLFRVGMACSGIACDTAFSSPEPIVFSTTPIAVATSNSPVCLGFSLQLQGSGGTSYQWNGPAAFNSLMQNPLLTNANPSMSGTYNMTVTNADGCTATTSTQVAVIVCVELCGNGMDDDGDGSSDCADTDCSVKHFDIFANGATAFCFGGQVELQADTSGTYLWSTGETTKTITASASGIYQVTVTNGENCTLTRSIEVKEHDEVTASASASGTSCENGQATLAATGGKYFHWQGPGGFQAHIKSFTLNELQTGRGGVYQVTVSDANGCTATAATALSVGIQPKIGGANGGQLTCFSPNINLSVATPIPGLNFAWSGPNGFSSSSETPSVSEPGIYAVTATDPATGCSFSDTAQVFKADTAFTVNCFALSKINCVSDSVVIGYDTDMKNLHTQWAGPDSYLGHQRNPCVKMPGRYDLVVTNLITGCQSTCYVMVEEDKEQPTGVAMGGQLECGISETQLTCLASMPGMKYFWTGPGGFGSAEQSPKVKQAGMYHVKVFDPENGCFSEEYDVEVEGGQ